MTKMMQWQIKNIEDQKEIRQAATLLTQSLTAINREVGKILYHVDLESEVAFLSATTTSLALYDVNTTKMLGMIAIEEDSIERIAIDPAYWRQGLGRILFERAIEEFHVRYIDVATDNQRAVAFVEAMDMAMFDETAPEPGDLLAKTPHSITHFML